MQGATLDALRDMEGATSDMLHIMLGAMLEADQGDDKFAGLLKDAKSTDLGHCLWHACQLGQPQCVRLLLAARAAIDQPDIDGDMPLYIACRYGHGECTQLLLAARAAVDQPDIDGATPLYAACRTQIPGRWQGQGALDPTYHLTACATSRKVLPLPMRAPFTAPTFTFTLH